MKKFDPTKPVQTRKGWKARIICTDRKKSAAAIPLPILALVTAPGETEESIHSYREDGGFGLTGEHDMDLINVPEMVKINTTVWVNVYAGGVVYVYITKALANSNAAGDRLACVPYTINLEVPLGAGL